MDDMLNHPDALTRLRYVVHRLRAPGGCPWDMEQTHTSLIPHVIEEAYEVADAIRSGDPAQICDELGDILLQPVLHAEIASETGAFRQNSDQGDSSYCIDSGNRNSTTSQN